MSSSKQQLGFPFDSEEEYELVLGESFLSSRPNTGFHTIRYDFKPASVDTAQPGELVVGEGGEVNVSLPNTQESGTTAYKGPKKPCPKECVLVVDRGKRTITLERLANTVQLKKIRSTSNSANTKLNNSSSQGFQQTETNVLPSQEDPKASAKPVHEMMQSTESSNSSSSESDSDLEDVDEEVAKLNARLIDQSTTDQTKPVSARAESSSSFNLREDLELSESGSDSD